MPHQKKELEGLFIPACLLIGMGVGFLIDNIPAAMFIGLGAGFLLFILVRILRSKR